MDRAELLERLTADVLAYVMEGSVPTDHLSSELAPTGVDERFRDYEGLVALHFVLRQDVVDFVEALPDRLRSLKTQTRGVSERTRGGVSGRIEWGQTVRERYSRNPRDTSVFVCSNRTEDYDIPENLVLRRLLGLIYRTLEDAQRYLERDYAWVRQRWQGERDTIETMRSVFRRNVHVARIREPADTEPTERMIERTHAARDALYREAADLLSAYRAALDGDPQAVARLLRETAITPDDDETLFELFVLFRYLSAVQELAGGEFEVATIDRGSQEVARLEGEETEIVVYHDSAARAEGLAFRSDVHERRDPTSLSRTERVEYEAARVSDRYFLDREFRDVSGRPDVIVLEVHHNGQTEYLVTEVKYSARAETVRRGIAETLEYLAFLREDGDFVHSENRMFGDGWNGVLVADDIPDTETAPPEEQETITILQASEVESRLHAVLEELVPPSRTRSESSTPRSRSPGPPRAPS